MKTKLKRITVPDEIVDGIMQEFLKGLDKRLKKHGPGAFASRHETLGILQEEFDELNEAVRDDKDGHAHFRKELMDIAVAAIFGMASYDVTYGES